MTKKRHQEARTAHKANPKHHNIEMQEKPEETKLDRVLIENFVSLQRVLTNLAVNIDSLTNRISKLLELFEISAKALAEKDFEIQEESAHLAERLDSLIDQNKILARGMALMHERMPREQFPPPMANVPPATPFQMSMSAPRPGSAYTKELQTPAPPPYYEEPRPKKNNQNSEMEPTFESPLE